MPGTTKTKTLGEEAAAFRNAGGRSFAAWLQSMLGWI